MLRPGDAQAIQQKAHAISALDIDSVAEKLYELYDEEAVRLAQKEIAASDCQRGCAWCCHRVVPATMAEVALSTLKIKAEFSVDELAALKQRLADYERKVAPHFGLALERLRPVCPLLVDNGCSIYNHRPLACRSRFSTCVADCEANAVDPDHPVPQPKSLEEIGRILSADLHHKLSSAAVVNETHDFARALSLALDNPDLISEWKDQGITSMPAVLREDSSDSKQPEPAATQVSHPLYGLTQEPDGRFDGRGLARSNYFAKRIGDNARAIEEAKGHHPGYRLYRTRVPMCYSSADEIQPWRNHFEKSIRDLFVDKHLDAKQGFDGINAFSSHELSYQQLNNCDLLAASGDLLCNHISARALPDLTAPITTPRKPGKPRVGFASRNLRSSSISPWTLGWLGGLDGDLFDIYSFNLGETHDQDSEYFFEHSQYFHMKAGDFPVPGEARFIKNLDLDVLIFPDVGVNMRNTQMATLRLARTQMAAWGGPETSGLPTIDIYLSGELMEPANGQDHYTEKLVCLPGTGLCIHKQFFPVSNLVKADFGLGDGPLIVSLQHAPKFDPQWDHLYREINEATGRPIVLVDKPGVAGQVFKRRMEEQGIQIHWLPYLGLADYLGLIRCADVIVDTPGWNGGITTIHALEQGTPVVTLPTELRRGRQSYCFLQAANAPGLIAKDESDFVNLVATPDRYKEAMKNAESEAIFYDQQSCVALSDLIQSLVANAP